MKEKIFPIYNILFIKKKIKGKGNELDYNKALLKKSKIDIEGFGNKIIIGKGARICSSTIFIRGNNHIIYIGSKSIIKNSVLWIEDEHCKIHIGEKTTIEGAHIAVTEPHSKIEIGKDCMLSSGVDIRNGDSHSILNNDTNKRINYAKDICIKDHVWIGYGVQILKGVNIDSNSIIGIRSLVTKSISSNCLAVGIPAEVVKENINWERERIYD